MITRRQKIEKTEQMKVKTPGRGHELNFAGVNTFVYLNTEM